MARSSSIPAFLFLFVILAVIGGGGYMLFKDTDAPELVLTPDVERVSAGQQFRVTAKDTSSAVKSITVGLRRGARTQMLLEQTFSDGAKEQTATFALKDLSFKEGAFELEVRAADNSFAGFGRGNSVTRTFAMRLDSSPPRTTVKTMPPYVRRGGTGCIVYSVSKEASQTGVKVGDNFFPGYKQSNGDYICFFAFPYFLTVQNYQPELIAVDMAGNKTSSRLPVYRINRAFREDTLKISDNLLAMKMPEFTQQVPGTMSEIERFNKVNSELRAANQAVLLSLGQKSANAMFWGDYFLRLPNGAPKAGFADHRIYMHNGQKQSVEATHLGLDLASIAQSPVPASNAGVVVFARDLGIYGNTVVIDHGLGLQSLYAHLTDFNVTEGQKLQRGDIIGRTGATGMVMGDHLHFGITVSGVEVTPIEWLDGHWIRDNVVDRITTAGGVAPALSTPPSEPAPAPKAASSAPGKASAKSPSKAAAKKTAAPAKKKR